MATTVSPQASPLSQRLVKETALGSTDVLNVTGTSGSWWSLDIDNTANGHITYVRMWDNLDPTNGTTDPDWIVSVDSNERRTITAPEGALFAVGLSMAAVRDAGTAGTTAPAGAVVVQMVTA